MRDSELWELGWVQAYCRATAFVHKLHLRSFSLSLSLSGETFSPAVTTELKWGMANLIITMTVMAVIQKRKFRSHKTN